MNILPKKSWHVRNKDNVARVRRDEAKALEEEKEKAKRQQLAEQEARISFLRNRSTALQSNELQSLATDATVVWDLPQEPELSSDDESKDSSELIQDAKSEYIPINVAHPTDQHINLFEEFEQKKLKQGSNKEYEEEKRKAQENYEKKIGYLTYLGQSASEALDEKPWYEKHVNRTEITNRSVSSDQVLKSADPLKDMKKYLKQKKEMEDQFYGRKKETVTGKVEAGHSKRKRHNSTSEMTNDEPQQRHKKSKHKEHVKEKHHKHKHKHKHRQQCDERSGPDTPKSKSKTTEELRKERIKREEAEKNRSLHLIAHIQGYQTPRAKQIDERDLKYNSVFNPQINSHR